MDILTRLLGPIALLLLAIGFPAAHSARAQSPDRSLSRPAGQTTSLSKPSEERRNEFPLDLDDRHTLQVGDSVGYVVIEEGAEPITLTVASSGEIAFPLVGRVAAQGRTCREVAQEVRRRLERSFYHRATVSLALETESSIPLGRVFISGQVASQGPIDIPRKHTLTVSQAILLAGGFADFADRRRVRLIRPLAGGGSETIKVDVKAVLEKGETDKDQVIQPGDFILVPERLFNF